MLAETSKVSVIAIWMMIALNPTYPATLAAQNKHTETGKDLTVQIIAPKTSVCAGSDLAIDVELQNVSKRVLRLSLRSSDMTYFEMIEPEPERGSAKPEFLEDQSLASEQYQFGKSYPFQSSTRLGISYDTVDSIPPIHRNVPVILQAGETHRHSLSLPLSVEFFKVNRFYRLYVETDPTFQAATHSLERSATESGNLYRSNDIIFRIQECKTNAKAMRK
jgi:hypothetical protein